MEGHIIQKEVVPDRLLLTY